MSDSWEHYLAALTEVATLDTDKQAAIEAANDAHQRSVQTLESAWRADDLRWSEAEEQLESLRRQLNTLAGKVGAGNVGGASATVVASTAPDDIPAALDDVRRRIAAAEESWQWAQRYRHRPQPEPTPVMAAATPAPALPAPPPMPPEVPPPTRLTWTPAVLIVVAVAVVLVLLALLAL